MNDTWIKALLLVCTFASVLILVETLVRAIANSRIGGNAINLRLRMIAEGRGRGETMRLLRRRDSSVPDSLPMFLQRFGGRLERMLSAAQVTMPTGRLMLAIFVAPLAIFFGVLLILISIEAPIGIGRLMVIATFAACAGAVLPLLFLQFKANRTRRKMEEQFPVALDVFVRGLRAGHPIAAALDLLTVEMPDPIGSEFGLVVDEVTYGAELRDALQAMAERWDLDDMRMFVVSLSVQSETGGNLAEILENLAGVVRERHSMMLKVRALSSEGRMTAVMLSALPVLAFTMVFISTPSFYLNVADDPAFIPSYLILLVMYSIGFIMIRKMIDLKV